MILIPWRVLGVGCISLSDSAARRAKNSPCRFSGSCFKLFFWRFPAKKELIDCEEWFKIEVTPHFVMIFVIVLDSGISHNKSTKALLISLKAGEDQERSCIRNAALRNSQVIVKVDIGQYWTL